MQGKYNKWNKNAIENYYTVILVLQETCRIVFLLHFICIIYVIKM